MNLKKTKYIFKQAFKSIWRNRMMGLASVGSVMAVLIILGFILLIVLNINNLALVTKESFDEIAVYIDDDADIELIKQMDKDFRQIDGVLSVGFQTKDYALLKLKSDWGDDASLLDGLKENPLPNTYIVQLTDVENSDRVIKRLKQHDGVEEVRFYKDAVNSLISISDFIKRVGSGLIIILLLISIFIISNTIKITVLNRRKEIELMQYIGATNGYVRGPFMIEGVILGLLGSFAAIIILMMGYNYFIEYLAGRYVTLLSGLSGYIVGLDMILMDLTIIFLTIGIGIGILGSLISLKKFLSI
ncbi:cell division transport system permease protein [Sedimentibacter acidaminivorans]|uniref:Cell division protein FtsX n=1 Tax=Sedimentibacter acidaminivorans TaxID=913099 RepID=A0ABS4G944_9FIRM|nr:permease-like cell division protein FtsX [Sedimentibacter acidaminivorans]MBP1924200.1 cell division transport system permease protein [Sedimentibacter acidaminivorans]